MVARGMHLTAQIAGKSIVPFLVDLRKQYDVPVYDQLCLNSCTANALCSAYGLDVEKRSRKFSSRLYFKPSLLFLYYVTRHIEENVAEDKGVYGLRDAIKAMQREGVCREEDWSYDPKKFEEKLPHECYTAAIKAKGNQVSTYERLDQDIGQLRACLKEECPFIFAFNIYKSFHSQENGQMPEPTYHEVARGPLGTHAVMAVGYNDIQKHIVVLNSWGKDWGDRGYFYMPYEFISDPNMSFDFWKVNFAGPLGVMLVADTLAFGTDMLIDVLVFSKVVQFFTRAADKKSAKSLVLNKVISVIDVLDEEARLRQGVPNREVAEDAFREGLQREESCDGDEVPATSAREQLRQHFYLFSTDVANLIKWKSQQLRVMLLITILTFFVIFLAMCDIVFMDY